MRFKYSVPLPVKTRNERSTGSLIYPHSPPATQINEKQNKNKQTSGGPCQQLLLPSCLIIFKLKTTATCTQRELNQGHDSNEACFKEPRYFMNSKALFAVMH